MRAKGNEDGTPGTPPDGAGMFVTDRLPTVHAKLGIPPMQRSLANRAGAHLTCHSGTPLAIQADGGSSNCVGTEAYHASTCGRHSLIIVSGFVCILALLRAQFG